MVWKMSTAKCWQVAFSPPRPFSKLLYKKLSKAKQAKLRKKLEKKNLKVVRKYVDSQGRRRVTLKENGF